MTPMARQMIRRPLQNTPRNPVPTQAEAEIDRAVERVYQMYGPDLSVFFDAVRHQTEIEQNCHLEQREPQLAE
jgi:hypothetical protein